MELSRINWSAAAVELADEHHRTKTPRARRALAAVSSLRGRFSDDFTVAAASAVRAVELEPLDPMHRVREALMRLRFGDVEGAIARLDALGEGVSDLPLVLVIKALATARRGEPRTARNIADRALQVDAKHAGAKFLHTETNLAAQAKGGLDKLAELPKGAAYDAAWADLLSKLAITRPGDTRAVAAQLDRGVITKGTRADSLARTVIAWTAASADELAAAVAAQPKDSRAEQVALGLLQLKLDDDATAAVKILRGLQAREPDRAAVRRALVSAMTRLAVDEAASERFAAALRAVQVCLELEPHEPVHHQNRAALFTLLGEHEASLDAWSELDRHHYRLALLGRLDPVSTRRYGAPHRMFSQAARLSGRTGVFLVEETRKGALTEKELVVNQEAIDRDPEQLRQWLHHTRAALVWGFAGLGTQQNRVLLAPSSPAVAEARAESLCALTQSLAVLVPDEGDRLAQRLSARFRTAAQGAQMRYSTPEPDADALAVHRLAVETYAELALLCIRWEPDPNKRALFDEVLETVRAVSTLFDERVLEGLLAERRDGPPTALGFLESIMRVVLEISTREVHLDPQQRKRIANMLTANLRVNIVERRVVDSQSELSRHEIEGLVEQLDLARKDDPESAKLEYWAAHLLMVGDFLDEAVEAISAFHKVAKGDHPMASRIERIQELIDEKRKAGRTKQRQGGIGGAPIASRDDKDIAMREQELEVQPTSMHLYTELCHELAMADRWRDAHAWAGRALARCLTPAGQTRARELALELLGLEILGRADTAAMATFIAGARASAVPAFDKISSSDSEASLEYVRGLSLLAADRRNLAQAAFKLAFERCKRGIFLAVLRPLAQDVETAVLEAAKKEIDTALAEGRLRDAFERIAERMTSVSRPEPYVLELARTQLSALLPTIGTGDAPLAPPPLRVDAPWKVELAAALGAKDPAIRIRLLAELAAKVHDPSAREAAALIRKLDDLDEQLGLASALEQSSKKAAAGNTAAALEVLGDLGPAGDRSARVLRQRAILLLKLERFDDADIEIAKLAQLPEPLAREFAGRYPGLLFRQKIASASGHVRAKDFAQARLLLDACVPTAPDQEVELAYCRGYCAAADGYRAHQEGDRVNAKRLLLEALKHVEAKLGEARTMRHERLLELYTQLEKDVG
ncbi:MAG: hypothetical protein H0T46_11505 [Deltaproteobacteria bacterium]|nr:hypothetical protein [Deltaproteobacteria bacterium]